MSGIDPSLYLGKEKVMTWYFWLLLVSALVWIVCAVANYFFLKKMRCEVVLHGEGGHFWLFFAPIWVAPFFLQYRDWKRDGTID